MTVNNMTSDTKNLIIRRAEQADLPEIVALDERISGTDEKNDYLLKLYERYQSRRPDERFFYIAENSGPDGKKIVGFVIGEIRAWEFGSEPCGWIFAISIDQDVRESGTGTALLEQLEKSFRDAGIYRLRTMVSRNNQLLMSFFRSHGMMAGPYIQLEKGLT